MRLEASLYKTRYRSPSEAANRLHERAERLADDWSRLPPRRVIRTLYGMSQVEHERERAPVADQLALNLRIGAGW